MISWFSLGEKWFSGSFVAGGQERCEELGIKHQYRGYGFIPSWRDTGTAWSRDERHITCVWCVR